MRLNTIERKRFRVRKNLNMYQRIDIDWVFQDLQEI